MTYSVIFISGSIAEVNQTNAIIECTGTYSTTCSIPTASSVSGDCLYIYNNSENILTIQSLDGIFEGPFGSGYSFLPIAVGATAYVFSDGTNWIVPELSYNHNNSPYVSIDSPLFTGTPSGPNPETGADNNQFATTAFVQEAISLVSGISVVNGVISAPGLTFPLSNTGVTPGTYNTIVVHVDGRIFAASNTPYPICRNLEAFLQGR